MDVLLQSVTKRKHSLKFTVTIVFGTVFLGAFFQAGRAIENNPPPFVPVYNNSPEANLRGIEFRTDASLAGGDGEEYGYQTDDTVPYSWKDPASATPVSFSSPDDGFAGPVSMGFVFPFYENTYSEIYLSTNGFISFSPVKEVSNSAQNQEIPYEIVPNDFIAPFWADLAVGGEYNEGVVSTMQGSDGNGPFFAIHYVNITRFASSDLLTFQIILYQNGDIWFQYNSLTGDLSATVGIEDGDGLSGLSYSSALLQNGLAVRFQRPGDAARVKLLSTLASGLTQTGVREFPIQIRNTGELGADTYNLVAEDVSASGWLVTLRDENGNLLTDTNGDAIVDTGLVSQGDTILIHVRLETGEGIGDHASFLLTATSDLDSGMSDEASLRAAVPSQHFIAFGNSAGLDLGRTTIDRQIVFDVTDFGDYPSLALANNQYFYVWEDADFNPGTDIEYAVLGYGGNALYPPTKLTTNADEDYQIRDFSPALAVSGNNRVGVVWVRRIIDPAQLPLGENYNVFWAILDTNGNVLVPPAPVTINDPNSAFCIANPEFCWQDGDNIDVPVFGSPMIMATPDNRFIISWIDARILEGGNVTDIGFAVFDTEGNVLGSPDDLKNGNTGEEEFATPRMLPLSNERMLVTYSEFDPVTNIHIPAYGVYSTAEDTLGDEIQGDVLLLGQQGRNPDTVSLNNSKILLAWTDTTINQITFTILTDDGTLLNLDNPYVDLLTPDGRDSNFVSVAGTSAGQGILCWVDVKAGNRVYYALVGPDGTVITPPVFAWEDTETITVSQTGQGIVTIPDWRTFMPIVVR